MVGAQLDRRDQPVGRVVVGAGVIDPRVRPGARVAQLARRRLVVEALFGDGPDGVAVAVVESLRLRQHVVVGYAAGGRPGCAAGAVCRERECDPPCAVVGGLVPLTARHRGRHHVATVVVVVVGRKGCRGDKHPGRRAHVEGLGEVQPAAVVVGVRNLKPQQARRRRLGHPAR